MDVSPRQPTHNGAGGPTSAVSKARGMALGFDPRRWQLWDLRPRVILFLIVWELLAVAWVVSDVPDSPNPTVQDLLRFAGLAFCAIVHILITRKQDERRRSRQLASVQVDLSGVWTLPAALLLPTSLSLALVLLIGGTRWFNWPRPTHRFVFNTCTSAIAVLLANTIFRQLDPSLLTDADPNGPLAQFGILLAAGIVYALVQMLGIGLVVALSSPTQPTWRNVLGSKTDNLLDAATIGMGTMTAILLVHVPPSIAVMVLISALGNRLAEISQLQEEAQTDVKTGLLNMRGWSAAANRAFDRAKRSDEPIALLMIDLDHFKSINDDYGHPAGDEVLQQVGQLLTKAVRPSDVVGRFGGEEFVLLLINTDMDKADHAAERIRAAVAGLHIATAGRRGAPVTITERTTSIGVAVHPDHGEDLDQLLHAADAAVYEAKDRGRDRVCFATTAPGSLAEDVHHDVRYDRPA